MGPEGRVAATEGWRGAAERGGLAWVTAWSANALTTPDLPRRLVFLSTDRLFEHHAKLANRMAAHLQLTCETIDSCAWLSAGMLSTNAATAQASANAYHEHLVRCASKTGYDAVSSRSPVCLTSWRPSLRRGPLTFFGEGEARIKTCFASWHSDSWQTRIACWGAKAFMHNGSGLNKTLVA